MAAALSVGLPMGARASGVNGAAATGLRGASCRYATTPAPATNSAIRTIWGSPNGWRFGGAAADSGKLLPTYSHLPDQKRRRSDRAAKLEVRSHLLQAHQHLLQVPSDRDLGDRI